MDSYQEPRSPEDIERDIERTRQEMAGTLDHLQKQLSPGQLVDQALSYLGTQSEHLGSDLIATLRTNPVPATLAGAGLTWLLAVGLPHPQQPGTHPQPTAPDYSLGEKSFVERRLGMDRRMNGSSGQGWHGHRAMAGIDMESGTSFPIERRRSERRGDPASAQVKQYAEEAETWTKRLIEEQPLLLGAFGLALGALLGAGLSASRMTSRSATAAAQSDTPTASQTKASTWRGPEPTASTTSMHETPFFAERAHSASDIPIT